MFTPFQPYTPRIKPPATWGLYSGWNSAANVKRWHDQNGLPHPVLCLPMLEGAGTKTYDLSGNGHSQYTGGGGMSWGRGVAGVEFELNGSSDYIAINDADDLSFIINFGVDGPFSVVTHARLDDATNFVLFRKLSTALGFEYQGLVGATDRLSFILYKSDASAYIGRYRLTQETDGSDMHLAFTYDGSEASTGLKIYKNIERVDTNDTNNGSYTGMTNTANSYVMGVTNAGVFADGSIRYNYLYGSELTQDQIRILYENPYGMFYPINMPKYFDYGVFVSVPTIMQQHNQFNGGGISI